MFTEYALIDVEGICHQKSLSVIDKLQEINGPRLVTSLIKPLVSLINKTKSNENSMTCLQDDKDVLWIMEVICFGLSLPLSDNEQYEAVRDCISIYCEWLHILSPVQAKDKYIPHPLQRDPNAYCQKIVGHLYNAFLPRTGDNDAENIADLISKQALICHRILRLIITIASEKDNVINQKTWECILVFLLGINQKLLQLPIDNDIGTFIADRLISTLFQGWLLSCVHFFPSPSYWKTFQSICIQLRHRPALVSQWNRVNVCLTRSLVNLLYKFENPKTIDKMSFTQYNCFVVLLNVDVIKQCWYRFLHLIGNPIELCFPEIIYKNQVSNSLEFSNSYSLPFIFYKAIKGLCTLVDIFLGISNINLEDIDYEVTHQYSKKSLNISSNQQFSLSKTKTNFSILKNDKPNIPKNNFSIKDSKNIAYNSISPSFTLPEGNFAQNHIKLISILDIFGEWLFQAAFIGLSNHSLADVYATSLFRCDLSQPVYDLLNQKNDNLLLENFEAGQAEAIGALCRIFCFKKNDEDISIILSRLNNSDSVKLKNYLTCFYLALKLCFTTCYKNSKNQLLSNILVNSVHFFEADLPGSKILIPYFLGCIESFLIPKNKSESSDKILIRRACIKILISFLSYPLHYKNLPIKDSLSETSCSTFISFFSRLILLLIHGLYNETDQTNIQMILCSFYLIVEDCVHHKNLCFNADTLDSNHFISINLIDFFNGESEYFFDKYRFEDLGNIYYFIVEFNFADYFLFSNFSLKGLNLFLLMTSFVSNVLCKSSAKNSFYSTSLTALEILSSLGRIKHNQRLLCNNKCFLCIKQICHFIENQCYKPATHHSKDLHSTIVAAYQCLSIWIDEHFHLIKDQNCILMLLELIELGISGSKSRNNKEKTPKFEKILKPSSMRVREAAEFLLSTVMSRLDSNSFQNNEPLFSCDINESKIVERLFNIKSSECAFNQFSYFVIENSLLISILDKPISRGEAFCIVRSAHGKFCWIFKYQTSPIATNQTQGIQQDIVYRSLNKQELNYGKSLAFNYFPEFYDKICKTKYDNIVPVLNNYINRTNKTKQDFEIMVNLIEKVEKNLSSEKAKLILNSTKKDFNEPSLSKTFDAYRLILSQFQVFNFNIKNMDEKSQNLFFLNNKSKSFVESLTKLDKISTKNNDLIMIFYIPINFQEESEIFSNNSSVEFREFLSTLGNLISCKTNFCSTVYCWNDLLYELFFVTPAIDNLKSNKISFSIFIQESGESIRNFLLESHPENNSTNDQVKEFLRNNNGCDIKLFVLWIEQLEDFNKLPFKKNEFDSNNDEKYCVIVINPLKNGLYRVLCHTYLAKTINTIIDRVLLSKHLLAPYIRLFALNLFRKRRMNIENFQMPHVRRRLKIQELTNKFKLKQNNQKQIFELFKSKYL